MQLANAKRGLWIDTSDILTEDACKWLLDHQVVGVIRYVARWITDPDTTKPVVGGWFYVLSRGETQRILKSGLQLSVIQAAKATGKPYLNYDYGVELGEIAAKNYYNQELPEEATIWWDAEWNDGPSEEQVIACGQGWADAARAKELRPGPYIGYDAVSGAGWFSLKGVWHYWASAMSIKSPQPHDSDNLERNARWAKYEQRGLQMRQTLSVRLPILGYDRGLNADYNVVSYDDRGDLPIVIQG